MVIIRSEYLIIGWKLHWEITLREAKKLRWLILLKRSNSSQKLIVDWINYSEI